MSALAKSFMDIFPAKGNVVTLKVDSKECTKCGIVKPLHSFGKYSKSKDGLRGQCKDCKNSWYVKKGYDGRRKLIEGGRICNVCGEGKTWDQFSKDRTGLNGKTATCIPCRNDKGREVYKNNPAVRRLGGFESRPDRLKRQYGLTIQDVQGMLAIQFGRCANIGCGCEISFKPIGDQKRAVIDHCHSTGRIRALLCGRCNTLCGYIEKSKTSVFGLFDYLNKHFSVGQKGE